MYWRGLMLDVTAEKEAEEKLRWSLELLRRTIEQRRELAQKIETAQEEERRRIAADIHDDPIQVMSAVDLRLAMLAEQPETITTAALGELQSTVRGSIERLRSLVFELRPAALDSEGLVVAIDQYLARSAKETGWTHEVVDELTHEPEPELRAALYRIVQEAVANAHKHADARHVSVCLDGGGRGDGGRGRRRIWVRHRGRGHARARASRARNDDRARRTGRRVVSRLQRCRRRDHGGVLAPVGREPRRLRPADRQSGSSAGAARAPTRSPPRADRHRRRPGIVAPRRVGAARDRRDHLEAAAPPVAGDRRRGARRDAAVQLVGEVSAVAARRTAGRTSSGTSRPCGPSRVSSSA